MHDKACVIQVVKKILDYEISIIYLWWHGPFIKPQYAVQFVFPGYKLSILNSLHTIKG